MSSQGLDLETYNQIVASGALEGKHVELLEGLVVDMSPSSTVRADVIMLLTRHFAQASAWLRVQLPLEVPPDSEPEPDLALVASRPPHGEHPRTALLVVEVSVSSQRIDREIKRRLYAQVGIPTYWLIDVPPASSRFTRCRAVTVTPTARDMPASQCSPVRSRVWATCRFLLCSTT